MDKTASVLIATMIMAAPLPALCEPPMREGMQRPEDPEGGMAGKLFGPDQGPKNAERLEGSAAALNTEAVEGCPILDPLTNNLFIASNRPGGKGGLDIWMAPYNGKGWGEPVNLPEPINSAANEFCPTPLPGGMLFFVSTREELNGDIYLAWRVPSGYAGLRRLPEPVNGPGAELSPSFVSTGLGGNLLYFSSSRDGDQDIYVAEDYDVIANTVGPVRPVEELNTPFSDARPNVRRDGLEIVFDTDRYRGVVPRIWTSHRRHIGERWSPPEPIEQVNDPAGQSRASLSWNGRILVFGSPREGGEGAADIYVSKRKALERKKPRRQRRER